MPDINGTSGADNIDVTNDEGTPQGSPINNIRARGGADDITVTDSTISGRLGAGGGSDTVTIHGSDIGRIRLGGGNDTLEILGTTVSNDIRGGSGTDSLNLPVGTVVTDATHGTFTVTVGGSYSLSSGTFTLPSGNTIPYSSFENGTGIPCFTSDTRIATPHGLAAVQDLTAGDTVLTKDHGPMPIRWVGSRQYSANELIADSKLRPVRIAAGALGNGLPHRDLLVSRQHRLTVSSKIVERMFGVSDVLIPAIKLTRLPGIYTDDSVEGVGYFHLLFDRHEVIYAEGAPTESLYTGPEALKMFGPAARIEILTIFPQVAELDYAPDPACIIPQGRRQKRLVERHLKNSKPLRPAPPL